jgi:DNA-binding LacI/PurR family transcriptional regulator
MEVAAQLNYKPNRFARGLVTGRSNMIGLIVSDVRNPYFAEVARGVEDAAYAAGFDVVLCNSDLDSAKQMRYFNSLTEKRVEGIIMNSATGLTRAEQAYIAGSGVPIVLLSHPVRGMVFSTVTIDNRRGGALAAGCLLAAGHRHMVYFTGPKQHPGFSTRVDGFVKAVRSFGRGAQVTVTHGAQSLEGGYEMAMELLRHPGKITAIATANDTTAFGVMKAAAQLGVKVPEDISIVGFDDVEIAALVHPPLTTVRQPKYEIGSSAVDILLHLFSGKVRAPKHRVLGVELMERLSVQAPSSTSAAFRRKTATPK